MPISRITLEKYPNPIFIETGTCDGDGIQAAIEAGFRRIISIEISERHAIVSQCRFEDDARVRVIHGDSKAILGGVLSRVGEPATFWLDCGREDGEPSLTAELDAIAAHAVKGHSILIEKHGFRLQELMSKIRKIDARYRFWFEPSGQTKDGILVARFI